MSDTEQLLADKPKSKPTQFTQVLRFFNIVLSLIIIGFSIYCYVGKKIQDDHSIFQDPSIIVLPAYVALAGLIILCVEFNIGFVVRNMKFLFHYLGRGIFNVYVGILCFAMTRPEDQMYYRVIIYVVGGLLTLFGVFYIIAALFCCARASRDYEQEEEEPPSKSNRSSKVIDATKKSTKDQA